MGSGDAVSVLMGPVSPRPASLFLIHANIASPQLPTQLVPGGTSLVNRTPLVGFFTAFFEARYRSATTCSAGACCTTLPESPWARFGPAAFSRIVCSRSSATSCSVGRALREAMPREDAARGCSPARRVTCGLSCGGDQPPPARLRERPARFSTGCLRRGHGDRNAKTAWRRRSFDR